MKKTIQLIVVATLCLFLSSAAEAQTAALNIGDKVPDLAINNIMNYKTTTAKLSDFKGKLLILDFWATWCAACIQSFPKMELLQKEFKDKLQVLLVSSDSHEKNQAFFDKRKASTGKEFSLPRVDGDRALKQLFPYRLLPHYVWILDGTVKAITGGFELNSTTIKAMLTSETSLATKKDVDLNRPLFLSEQAPREKMQHYSLLLKGYTDGLGSSTRYRTKDGQEYGWMSSNSTILWFYQLAALKIFNSMGEKLYYNRMAIEVRDTSKLYLNSERKKDPLWRNEHLYSYELVVPIQEADKLYEYALEDLNRYSDYTGTIEKRRVKCLVLLKTGSEDLLHTAGKRPASKTGDGMLLLSNTGMINLIMALNAEAGPGLPVIDRTGYSGTFDMSIKAAWKDRSLLNSELARYGLTLQESEEELNMLVLKDKLTKPVQAEKTK